MKREREKKSKKKKKKKTTKTNDCGSVMMRITRVVYLTLNYILNISISISKHIIYLPTKIVVFYFVS